MAALYLLRHGPAASGGPDPQLSPEGAALVERAAKGMARLGLRVDRVLTSPLARAVETARIVAGALHAPEPPRVVAALQPGCTLAGLAAEVARIAREAGPGAAVLVVGHQPDLGRIAADLVGARGPLAFGTGTLCGMEVPGWDELTVDPPPATLGFLIPASVLEAVG